jgi:hypothetical protein
MGFVLSLGLCSFLALLLLQMALWRLLRVRREMLGLALVYLLLPALMCAILALLRSVDNTALVLSYLLYLALACGYIQTYPALREDIPSFRILFEIESAGAAGLTPQEIAGRLHADRGGLYSKKVEDLAQDGLICIGADGQMQLRPAGRTLARMFKLYRKTLGLGHGLG